MVYIVYTLKEINVPMKLVSYDSALPWDTIIGPFGLYTRVEKKYFGVMKQCHSDLSHRQM